MEKIIFESKYGKNYGFLSFFGKKKVMLLLPGFGASKKTKQFNTIEEMLNNNAISTLRIDQFGHGENADMFKELTVTKAIDVVKEWLDFLKKESYEKIGIVGSSFGGLTGFFSCLNNTDISLLLLKSPVLKDQGSIIAKFKDIDANEWRNKGIASWVEKEKNNSLKYDFFEDANKYVVKKVINDVSIPIKIVQGAKDSIVSVEQCRELENINNVNISILPTANHSLQREEMEELVRFFEEFIHKHW